MDLDNIKRIHLIGIGGCSMNGLAQILRARGYEVKGSDKAVSPFTETSFQPASMPSSSAMDPLSTFTTACFIVASQILHYIIIPPYVQTQISDIVLMEICLILHSFYN